MATKILIPVAGTNTLRLRLTVADIGYGIRYTKVEACNTASTSVSFSGITCYIGGATWFSGTMLFPANSAWTTLWTGQIDREYNQDITFNGNLSSLKFKTALKYTVNFYHAGVKKTSGTYNFSTAKALPTAASMGATESGYISFGWATADNSATAAYSDGASVSFESQSETINLYSVWGRTFTWKYGGPDTSSATTNDTQLKYYSGTTGKWITASKGPSPAAVAGYSCTGWRADNLVQAAAYSLNTAYTGSTNQLYAIYSRGVTVYGGTDKSTYPTTSYYNEQANSYKMYLPGVAQWTGMGITGWTPLGFRTDSTATTQTYGTNTSTTSKITVSALYVVYSRSVTVSHAGNGNTGGSTADTAKQTQYYNSYNTITSLATTANGFTKTGFYFNGWKDSAGNIIANNGRFTPAVTSTYYTITAQWAANALTFPNETKSTNFSTSAQTMTVGAASNGTGTYTYATDGTPTSGLSFNTSTRVLTLAANSTSGTYTAKIKVTDSNSKATATKTVTWTVSNAANPMSFATTESTSVTYGTTSRTITGATGAQGTLSYSLVSATYGGSAVTGVSVNSSNGTITLPVKNAGANFVVTVRATAAGVTNKYNSKTIDKVVTISVGKTNLSITATAKNAAYTGSAQYATIKVNSSGWDGKTIVSGSSTSYGTTVTSAGATNSTYNLSPGQTNYTSSAQTVYYKVTGGTNHNDATGSTTVTITKAGNGLSFGSTESTSVNYGTTSRTITGATGAHGAVTYSLVSATYNGSAVSGVSVNSSNGTITLPVQDANKNFVVTVRATAAGDGNHNSATKDKAVTITVKKADQNAPTATGSTTTYPTTATATASGGGGHGTLTWENGINSRTSVGTTNVRAYWAGNTNYNASGWSNTVAVTMNKANPTVTFDSWTKTYNGSSQNYTGKASVAGKLYMTWNGTVLTASNYSTAAQKNVSLSANTSATIDSDTNAGSWTYNFYFVPTDTTNYNAITPTKQTMTMNKAGGSAAVEVSSPTYNGSPVTIATVSKNTGTYYLGIGSSSTSAPSTWATANTPLTVSAIGTHHVWYKVDASDNYNAVGATYKGAATVAYTKYYFDVNPDSGISTFDIAGVDTPGTNLTDYYKQNNYGTTATLSNIKAKTGYTYTGYTLSGSLTAASGSSNTTPKATLGAGNGAIALNSKINSYTVAYNANGGSSTPSTTQPTNYNSTITLAAAISKANTDTNVTITITYDANNGSGAPSVSTGTAVNTTPYTFNKWALNSASGTQYEAGASYTIPAANSIMYATWNTGTTTRKSNPSITLSSTRPTRPGYNFLGWSTDRLASKASYSPGGTYTFSANTTLYAVWQPVYAYTKVSGTWKTGEVYVKVSGTWKRGKAYVKSGGTWKTL